MTAPERDTPGGDFDAYAEHYGRALDRGIAVSGEGKEYFARGRVQWLGRELAGRDFRPRAILDYGCGTGTAVPYLLELPGAERVRGVDISVKSIEVAQRDYGSARAGFSTDVAYAPDGSCDLAFCNGVFHHIPPGQRAAAMNYIHRALRPGGLFAFWENNPWNPGTRIVMARIPFDRDAITLPPPDARRLLQEGGFEILGTSFLFLFPGCLSFLRGLEAPLSRWPLGAQYQVLGRKPG